MPRVALSAPTYNNQDIDSRSWRDWFSLLYRRVGEGPFLIQGYSVANLPPTDLNGSESATDAFTSLIFIRDETGGSTLAFSDGTNWRRVSDRTIAS